MHPQAREHMNRPSLQMATEPVGHITDPLPILPDRQPKYPGAPQQRRRDQRRQPRRDEHPKPDTSDSERHIDDYA